jgi:hypothetical protein
LAPRSISGCHTFRAAGITAYLEAGGTSENAKRGARTPALRRSSTIGLVMRSQRMMRLTMKRRDLNRIALGTGVSAIFASSSLAQMSAEELQSAPAKAAPTIIIKNSPRTYNQINVPRKYTVGRRRFTIYWTWSYPWEANRDIAELDNRFPTMTERRRVGWPRYEEPEWSEREFLQGIAGIISSVDRAVSKPCRRGYRTSRRSLPAN